MAIVLRVEEQLGGETVRSVELWRDDGSGSIARPGALGLRLADAKAILAGLQAELVASEVGQLCREALLAGDAGQDCGSRITDRAVSTRFSGVSSTNPEKVATAQRGRPGSTGLVAELLRTA